MNVGLRRGKFAMHVRLRRGRLAMGAVASLAAASVLLPSSAGAAGEGVSSPADEFSAADQYVESVPTSRGPRRPGLEKREKASLPASVSGRIEREGGADAAQLEQIATSPDLGAPAKSAVPARRTEGAPAKSPPRVPAAAVTALGEGDDGGLPWLPVALVLITGLAVGTAGYRHHRYKNSAG
jgi:hypothetical protein